MTDSSRILTDVLNLREIDAAGGAGRSFEGVTGPCPWPKAYGGDPVAQAVVAGDRTVGGDRVLHSMHSAFLRPLTIGASVRYDVELIRDGRGYSSRQVRAVQDDKLAFLATMSYHVLEDGEEWQPTMPEVPGPEGIRTSAEVLAGVPGPAAEYWSHGRSFDQRHVPGPIYLEVEGGTAPHQAVWVKSFETLGDDPSLHRAALAYLCDYTILEAPLRVHGHAWGEPGLVTASLDHAMWFHRPARVDDWLLYAQEAASVQHARGLGLGRFFDRDGRLVATVAQEGMLRPARG